MSSRDSYNWSFLQDITIVPLIISWVSSKLSTHSSSWKGPADEMTAAKQKKKHQRYQEARKTYVAAYGLGSRSKSDLPSDILTRSKPRLLFGKHINLFAKWKGTKGTAARASGKQWRCIQICTVATLASLANTLREFPQIWHRQKSWWQFEGQFNLTKDAFSYKLKNLFISNQGQISHKRWNEMMDLRFPQDCKVALGQCFIQRCCHLIKWNHHRAQRLAARHRQTNRCTDQLGEMCVCCKLVHDATFYVTGLLISDNLPGTLGFFFLPLFTSSDG